jgi:predicted permease
MLELLSIFVNILLPVFTLVLVGYLAGPRLGLEARTLSKLAYYILVPAFIFDVFSSAQIELGLAARMAGYIMAVTVGGILASMAVARLLGAGRELMAAYVLIAAFGNVGNFGLPIIQFKLGDDALLAASVYFLVASTFGFIVGVTAATWDKGTNRWRAVLTAFTTPGVLAVAPAFLVNALGLPTPIFLERAVSLLSAALIPLMLVTLGVQLAGIPLGSGDQTHGAGDHAGWRHLCALHQPQHPADGARTVIAAIASRPTCSARLSGGGTRNILQDSARAQHLDDLPARHRGVGACLPIIFVPALVDQLRALATSTRPARRVRCSSGSMKPCRAARRDRSGAGLCRAAGEYVGQIQTNSQQVQFIPSVNDILELYPKFPEHDDLGGGQHLQHWRQRRGRHLLGLFDRAGDLLREPVHDHRRAAHPGLCTQPLSRRPTARNWRICCGGSGASGKRSCAAS